MVYSKFKAPGVVSIQLNDVCNLQCPHCYLEGISEKSLALSELDHVFNSLFRDLKPGAVSFIGKEIFAQEQSVAAFFNAIKVRNDVEQKEGRRSTDIGVTTNGTLLHRYKDKLLEYIPSLELIDISIDGPQPFHDSIRGRNAFARLEQNLEWLVTSCRDRIWITTTVFDQNAELIPEMMRILNETYGLRNFSLGIYKPINTASDALTVSDHAVTRFMHTLKDENWPRQKNITVLFDIPKEMPEYSRVFDLPEADGQWLTRCEEVWSNGVSLKVHRANVATGLWRAVRISPSGHWLAAEDLIEHKNYEALSIVNLRSVHYDTQRAYQLGLQSKRAKELGIVYMGLPGFEPGSQPPHG